MTTFNSSTPFVSTSSFGKQNTTIDAFGAQAVPSGGSGKPTTFGTTASSNTFGASAPVTSVFGSTIGGFGSGVKSSSPFGTPAPSAGTFGSSSPTASSGLFGPGTSSLVPGLSFKSTFGSPAPTPSPGRLGPSAPITFTSTNDPFGPISTGSTFGAPVGGTKLAPFAVTSKQDNFTDITQRPCINLHSISAMAQYEQKSFEELRLEDYSQGNRGTGNSATGNTGGFGGFGAPSPAPSKSIFGAPASTSSGFRPPATAPGGFSGSGTTTASSSGFGANNPFGPTSTGSNFRASAGGTFGAPAPAVGTFGTGAGVAGGTNPFAKQDASATNKSAFGGFGVPSSTPATGSSPGFGAPAPAPGLFSGFSTTQTSALSGGFGTTVGRGAQTPAFGAPPSGAARAPGSFGTPAFGTSAASTASPGSGIFGTPAPVQGGLTGPTPSAMPSFGATTFCMSSPSLVGPTPATNTFGVPAQSSNVSVLPALPPTPATPTGSQLNAAPPVGSIMPPTTNEILTAQLTAIENKRKEMETSDNFRTATNESPSVSGITISESESPKSLIPMRTSFPAYHAPPRSTAKIHPRGFAPPKRNASGVASTNRLAIKPNPKSRIKLSLEPASEKSGSILRINNSLALVSGSSP